MYNNLSKTRRGRPWLLLAALFAWLLPQNAVADSPLLQPYRYQVMLNGSNTVRISAPIYDEVSTDNWTNNATLTIKWTDKNKIEHSEVLLTWKADILVDPFGVSVYDNDKSEVPAKFETKTSGDIEITRGNSSQTFKITKGDGEVSKSIFADSDGEQYSFTAVWTIPYEMYDKEVTFQWDVKVGGSAYVHSTKTCSIDKTVIHLPERPTVASPQLAMATMSFNEPGMLELPWFIASDRVTSARYEYIDYNGVLVKKDLQSGISNGTIYLDADVPHNNLRVMVDYLDRDNNPIHVTSEPQTQQMIHVPVGLSARSLGDSKASVQLDWGVAYPKVEDIATTDFFEIQRSLTGKEEDFETIFSEPYIADSAQTHYTFVDSTLIDAVDKTMLKNGTLDSLTYRVRRMMTQAWGWNNRCVQTERCVVDEIHLRRIATYSAQWEDQRAFTARVSWEYADEPNAVWDDRAKMMLRVTVFNQAGDTVNIQNIELSPEEREQRYKVIDLSPSCVNYKVEMYIDRGTSPLPTYDEVKPYYFPIRTAGDWYEFCEKVIKAKGEYDVNARLYTDIESGRRPCGPEGYPYRGVFDGNGHTLTVDLMNYDPYLAPFRYVTNATIKNLHVAGDVWSDGQYAGGLIGYVLDGSDVTIENCRSSVTIYSTKTTNGGFIARLGDDGKAVIRNSKFDGSFEGGKSHHNGGFIGYCQNGSTAIIDNCLFAPDHISTALTSCQTWARGDGHTLNVTNSFATREYTSRVIIYNATDWHTFAVMVNDARGQYDVDAVLAADITTSEHVGVTEGAVYRGTFEGDGHTLTFNKDWTENERFIAPFRHASNATIKNLHVAGTIKSGQKYPAGIIAQVINGTTTIENCRSSVTLNSTITGESTLAGGLVGRVTDSNVTISNCRFDGSFEGEKSIGNGGFIAWVDEGSLAIIENSLFMPASVKTNPEKSETWARQDERGHVVINNCYATKEFCHLLENDSDWEEFRTALKNRGTKSVNAVMNADFTVNNSADDFKGIFDGNGHTLTMRGGGGSLFNSAHDYTIKNLHLTVTPNGSIGGGDYFAALVWNSYNANIQSCWVSSSMHCTDLNAGGFIGHGHDTDHTINNCLFDGAISAGDDGKLGSNSYVGAFIGYAGDIGFATVTNCLENGQYFYVGARALGFEGRQRICNNSVSDNNYSYGDRSEWYDIDKASSDVSEMVQKLGSGWVVSGNKAVPKMANRDLWNNVGSLSASDLASGLGSAWYVDGDKVLPMMSSSLIGASEGELAQFFTVGWTLDGSELNPIMTTTEEYNPVTYPDPQLPADNFYHEGNGEIGKTLMTETRQSSVVLTWDVEGVVDYFQVYRRIEGSGDNDWELVADNLDNTGYEDKSVSPLLRYEYKVRAVTDCEGKHHSETDVKAGACKNTGRVAGYVRLNDGTGVPDVEVTVTHDKLADNENDQAVTMTANTDETGYFVIDGLPYNGLSDIEYIVSPTVRGNIKFEDGKTRYTVTFDGEKNDESIPEFTIINSHRFSGYVMYDGTSIPVKGAHFKVDDHNIYDASGKLVETDFDGSFSFRVLDGQDSIQVWMDQHSFTEDGYYLDKNKNMAVITKDEADIYFYDATKVKLIGRVVGGNDQGDKPLDNNLSKNNLGNNLTMVMTLEGDNTSWLVYDNLNTDLKTRELTFPHAGGNGHQTTAVVERKRMTVKPDSVTGEYTLMLPPVRWKVQQVYCEGYPTLFQEGQTSEVIDLTDCLTAIDTTYTGIFYDVDKNRFEELQATYNAVYNRIYHAPVEISYKQLGYDSFDYFGDKSYMSTSVGSDKIEVPLARYDSISHTTHYTFGYPVFSLNRRYPVQVEVAERYRYNNDTRTGIVDIVPVGGGKVTVHNGMKNDPTPEVVELDSVGRSYFYITADQTVRLMTGADALKTVTLTLTQNGTTYEAEPLKAYTLNMFTTGGFKDVLVSGQPLLIDVLRDPPGGGSTATLSKGSKLKYAYSVDCTLKGGLQFSLVYGTMLDRFTGVVSAPEGVGTATGIMNNTDISKVFEFDYSLNAEGHRAFSYTMNVNEDITTSSDPNMVGADADLYIGMTQNIVVQPMSTIRAIPDSIFQQLKGRLGGGTTGGYSNDYGSMVDIAEGKDLNGNKFHLVRDESIGYGPEVTSQFVHSQKHILTQIIPEKIKELRALMFIGTAEDAQKKADATGKPVYRSLVPEDDDNFGLVNTKDGDIYYYTSSMKEEPGMNYVIHVPSSATTTPIDEVAEKCQTMLAWGLMIAKNEREKVATILGTTPFANYDVDGGTKVTYSEQFESDYTISNFISLPGVRGHQFFDTGGLDDGLSAGAMLGIKLLAALIEKGWAKTDKATQVSGKTSTDKADEFSTKVIFAGKTTQFRLVPIANFTTKGIDTEEKAYSRKETFNIVMDKKSHLNIDVYKALTDTATIKSNTALNVYSNQNFYNMTDFVQPFIKRGSTMAEAIYARSFVYRTRGGATVNPWESERRTIGYSPGYLLDERTKKIQNPKISLDRQSISGVAIDKPARFKVYLTNDSEQPEAATGSVALYNFNLDPKSNPNGAKLMLDGIAMTSSGWNLYLYPGEVVEKTLEVYAGTEFDYEGLKLGLMSCSDPDHIWEEATFDVHFLRQAGPVNISSPGDKWVMNTYASQDDKRGWFIPVTIDGFDKHQHNFDHIEFQYKESQRGDDSWTNLCSFYADSLLMTKASGEREMIPENGNIVTNFYGEGTVMEKAYDLRAVLFCRNGNEFLTTSSKILSGVKDTRRPQLFGTPEPTNGVLTQGDNIVFNFSEDIEYNYLSAITNFEVKGETNNDNISDAVSLQFKGQASVESEARRNFDGKSLTIDMMIEPDTLAKRDMPLFSHGTNGQKLQLWLTDDFKLKAVINDDKYVSDAAIQTGIFTQVAMSIDLASDSIAFYNGGKLLGKQKLLTHYTGTGKLIFGRTNEGDRMDSKYYEGRMMEARLWYRAMDGGLIGTTYGYRRLTGYETGLVDYYPMNEGSGDYVMDKTQGANAKLMGANWAVPRGYSLHLVNEGLELTTNAMNRTKEEDYTLMFWFKTDRNGRGVLVSNGAGTKTEDGAQNRFNIAFEAEKLMYRSNGFAMQVPGNWSDGQWHHYAMTVNRGVNVVNIYVDKELRTTFAADSLGAITGGIPMLGAAKYKEKNANGETVTIDTRNWLTGNIDEFCFFAQALPLSLVKTYSTKSPYGDEAGLLTYLAFDRQERLKNNKIETMPYAYSKKIHLDADGNIRYEEDPVTRKPTTTPIRDYVFVDSINVIQAHITDETAAPVVPFEELENLKFSFVGEGHKLLVNVNETAAKLNRRNLYVTVRDVEDKRGNAMASPQTAVFLVSNSSLEWLVNRLDHTIKYGTGEDDDQLLTLPFYNSSAISHTYTIENCPKWLALSSYTDVIAPQTLGYVNAKVSKDLNVGTYNEIIYLTDEDGISEPFYLNLTIEGEQPEWAEKVDGNLLANSMSIIGQVYINDELDTDARDIVGAFDSKGVCHGFANISNSTLTGEMGLYLTVYDSLATGRELNFRLWQYSTGREIVLTPESAITFAKDAMLGTETPVRFTGGSSFIQNFYLAEGWNWVSFNIQSESLFDLNKLLSGMSWTDGDVLTELGGKLTLNYENGQWLAGGSTANVVISPKKAYAIKVQKDCTFPIEGSVIKQKDARTINLKQGWNGIGYTPVVNLTVETALSDYYDYAEPGDVIKSHTEFAYFTKSGNTGRWRGSLQYMKPGEGYMMLRKGAADAKFSYPFFELGSNAGELWTTNTSYAAAAKARSTMSVSAVVEGFETEDGDKLIAFANGETVGEAILSPLTADLSPLFYLSIAADKPEKLWFAIERDGEIVASTGEIMTFKTNAVIGSPDQPTAINFVKAEYADGQWYSISGMKLQKRPTQSGVYIFNGRKMVIK